MKPTGQHHWLGPMRRALLATLFGLANFAPASLNAQTDAALEAHFAVSSFVVSGDNPISTSETAAILAPFTGPTLGLEDLQRAAEVLESELRTRGYTFHRVIIPPQRARSGIFNLQVLTFRIAQVKVRGNRHFSTANVLHSLPGLRAEQAPNAQILARAMRIAAQHPSKQVRVTMRESDTPDHIDALIDVRDAQPWAAFGSLSNTGTPGTGLYRLSLGAQHSNLFGLDHTATLSYTTAPGHFNDVTQLGAFYRIPLYRLGATLDASWVHSDVNSGTVGGVFQVSGSGRFVGLRYNQTLNSSVNYEQHLSVGIDDRAFVNRIDFLGRPLGNDVRSRPLSVRYQGHWKRDWGEAQVWAEYARNLPGGANNDASAYRAARTGASRSWDLLRYGASINHIFAQGWELSARVNGQRAQEPLIAGEQFGLGGADSVRGFEAREISGDDGIQFNLETYTPRFGPGLRLLGFAEGGKVKLANAQAGDLIRANVLSLGLGLRWQWQGRLSLSLDFAHVINGAASTTDGEEKLHLNLSVRL